MRLLVLGGSRGARSINRAVCDALPLMTGWKGKLTIAHQTGEADLEEAFYDCAPGAIPAVGEEYLIPTIVDERLRHLKEVFFEAGDHERLVHISSDGFSRLMEDAEYLSISAPHR